MKSKVSQDLQNTVAEHAHIDKVYFDKDGNHYLNVHSFAPKTEKDKQLGGTYGRIAVFSKVDEKTNHTTITEHPVLTTKIIEEATREEILSAKPISNFESQMLSGAAFSADEISQLKELLGTKGNKK